MVPVSFENRVRLLALVALTAACDSGASPFPFPNEPVYAVRPGIVSFHGEDVRIELPTSTEVGTPVMVKVFTFGGGCLATRRSSTRLTTNGLDVRIEPFDTAQVFLPEGWACTGNLTRIPHEVQVTFDRSGAATVEILGRRLPENESFTVRRTIVVN